MKIKDKIIITKPGDYHEFDDKKTAYSFRSQVYKYGRKAVSKKQIDNKFWIYIFD